MIIGRFRGLNLQKVTPMTILLRLSHQPHASALQSSMNCLLQHSKIYILLVNIGGKCKPTILGKELRSNIITIITDVSMYAARFPPMGPLKLRSESAKPL